MAKITYRHGTMGSGKSLSCIRTIFNYRERGMFPLVMKSTLDTRDATDACYISTRVGLREEAQWYSLQNLITCITARRPDIIIVDECQFLTEKEVYDIIFVSSETNIPVMFYGLKNTFTGELFDAVKIILARADDVQEDYSICDCGRKTKQNLRLINGKPVFTGETIQVGGNESYIAVCNECFNKAKKENMNEQ